MTRFHLNFKRITFLYPVNILYGTSSTATPVIKIMYSGCSAKKVNFLDALACNLHKYCTNIAVLQILQGIYVLHHSSVGISINIFLASRAHSHTSNHKCMWIKYMIIIPNIRHLQYVNTLCLCLPYTDMNIVHDHVQTPARMT